MKFTEVKKIDAVLDYHKINNGFACITKNHDFILNGKKLFENVGFDLNIQIDRLSFGYNYTEPNMKTTFLDLKTEEISHFPDISVVANSYNNGMCIAYVGKGLDYKIAKFDLTKFEIINVLKDLQSTYYSIIFQNFLIDKTSHTELICIDIETGLTNWRFNLLDHIDQFDDNGNPSKHQFAGIRQVYNNRLYIGVRNGLYAASLVAINLEDGSFYKKWDTLPDGLSWQEQNKPGAKEYNYFNFAFGIFVEKEGKIINLRGGASYWEFDLNTEEVIKYDLSEYFDEQEIWAINKPNITKQGDHLFFGVRLKPYVENSAWVNPMKMVAFNRRTKKIDWEMPFDKGLGCGNDIRFFDDDKTMCFIGAPDSTLYIYERE